MHRAPAPYRYRLGKRGTTNPVCPPIPRCLAAREETSALVATLVEGALANDLRHVEAYRYPATSIPLLATLHRQRQERIAHPYMVNGYYKARRSFGTVERPLVRAA